MHTFATRMLNTCGNLDCDTSFIGFSTRSVLDVLNHLEVCTDNYCESPELYFHLYNDSSITPWGTIRTNRR